MCLPLLRTVSLVILGFFFLASESTRPETEDLDRVSSVTWKQGSGREPEATASAPSSSPAPAAEKSAENEHQTSPSVPAEDQSAQHEHSKEASGGKDPVVDAATELSVEEVTTATKTLETSWGKRHDDQKKALDVVKEWKSASKDLRSSEEHVQKDMAKTIDAVKQEISTATHKASSADDEKGISAPAAAKKKTSAAAPAPASAS